jgi:hypothetical protein
MSFEVLSWALAQAPNVQRQCVAALVGLASHAGPDGTNAYPSVAKPASDARKSERSIQRDLKQLHGLVIEADQRYVAYLPADRRAIFYNLAVWLQGDVESPARPGSGKPSRSGQRTPLRWPFVLAEALPVAEGPSLCTAALGARGRRCDDRPSAVRIMDRSARPGNTLWPHVRAASLASGVA